VPTGAFGWNRRLIFTLNYVPPARGARPGLGRVFLARELLDFDGPGGLDAAVSWVTRPRGRGDALGMAAGHNYQALEWTSQRLVNVEVAPGAISARVEALPQAPARFHANRYLLLGGAVQQLASESSDRREARARAMLAQSPFPRNGTSPLSDAQVRARMTRVLGDQEDADYPIFHDKPTKTDEWTLTTIFVDGPAGTITFWDGNPKTTEACRVVRVEAHL
jgi:hypothetical protein